MFHIALHFLVPLGIAAGLYRSKFWVAYASLLVGLLIDVDHLLAEPIYEAGRCSVGFHPLHTMIPMIIYIGLLLYPKTRLVGIGLCIHILLDAIDCQMTNGVWFVG
ncbi:MAG: hypothetical protein ACI9ON_002299 [Limisphaerales bacterium]